MGLLLRIQLMWNAGRVDSSGVYTGLLYVLTGDQAVPNTIIPVTLTVLGPPSVYLPLVTYDPRSADDASRALRGYDGSEGASFTSLP